MRDVIYRYLYLIYTVIRVCCIMISGDESSTTENEIPVFPSTSPITSSTTTRMTLLNARPRHHASHSPNEHNGNSIQNGSNEQRLRHQNGQRRNLRLLKFLRHFRLDFSKFDSTCMKRAGRGLPAPPVTNAHVLRYTR